MHTPKVSDAWIRMAKNKKWAKDLSDCGMTIEQFIEGQRYFSSHGVSVGPKTGPSGRYTGEFTWLGVPETSSAITATCVTCRCSPSVLVRMFEEREQTLSRFGRSPKVEAT